MINIQEHSNDNILSLKVTDKLTKEDLDNLVPHLKDHVNSADLPH